MGFFSAGRRTRNSHRLSFAAERKPRGAYAIDTPRKQTARRMVLMVNCRSTRSQFRRAASGDLATRATGPTTVRRRSFPACSIVCQRVPEDRSEPRRGGARRTRAVGQEDFQPIRFWTASIQASSVGRRRWRWTDELRRQGARTRDMRRSRRRCRWEIFANSPNQMTMVVHTQGRRDSVTDLTTGRNGLEVRRRTS